MNTRDFVQLAMLAMDSPVQGKTKLQKTIYFLGLMTGCLDDLGYRAHFYGPYSDDVADAIGWLQTIGAVDQTSCGVGRIDDNGFEVRRFDFRLNQPGREFAELSRQRHPELWEKIREASSKLKRCGDLDYVRMSVAAKTYYMLSQVGGQASEPDLARLASRFGWEVTLDQVKEAAAYLGKLGVFGAPQPT